MIVEYTINLTKSWTDLKYASHKLRYTWKKHAEFYESYKMLQTYMTVQSKKCLS